MNTFRSAASIAAVALGLASGPSESAVTLVEFDTLVASTSVATLMGPGDSLLIDSLAQGSGTLLQSVSFTVGPNAPSFLGDAVWRVRLPVDYGAELLDDVNIDLFDAQGRLITSDNRTAAPNTWDFFTSTFKGNYVFTAGETYSLRITAQSHGLASMDVAMRFATDIPEPASAMLMLAGAGWLAAVCAARKRRTGHPGAPRQVRSM